MQAQSFCSWLQIRTALVLLADLGFGTVSTGAHSALVGIWNQTNERRNTMT
jgi:hypothetical protein